MFKEMRRRKQLLSAEDSAAVLNRGTSGVLALLGAPALEWGPYS